MKKLILPALLALSLSASAQKLPDTVKFKLTAPQILAISAKLDSIQLLLTNTSTAPSAQVSAFEARVNAVFSPMWLQVQKQIVVEKHKEVKKP